MFLRHLVRVAICWHPGKILRRSSQGTPPSATVDLSKAISRKRCEMGAKLVLITNRKLNMSFRLVPNSVTLDYLEQRNSPNHTVISPNSVAFGADYCLISWWFSCQFGWRMPFWIWLEMCFYHLEASVTHLYPLIHQMWCKYLESPKKKTFANVLPIDIRTYLPILADLS